MAEASSAPPKLSAGQKVWGGVGILIVVGLGLAVGSFIFFALLNLIVIAIGGGASELVGSLTSAGGALKALDTANRVFMMAGLQAWIRFIIYATLLIASAGAGFWVVEGFISKIRGN